MSYAGKISLSLSSVLTSSPDVGAARHNIAELWELSIGDGTGANQAKNHFADNFAISGAGTQTYDLAGALTNALGTVVFTAIKAIAIKNTGTAPLTYGGGSNPFLGFLGDASDEITIPAGGMILLADPTAGGQTVTASTGDIITISGTDAAGRIVIIGETA